MKTLMYLLPAVLLLTACTEPLPPPPQIQRIEISDALLTCAARPENPCTPPPPAQEPETVTVVPESRWHWFTSFFGEEKGAGEKNPFNVPPQTENFVCRETDRLQWEARLMFWGSDCKSKLGRVRALLRDYNATP